MGFHGIGLGRLEEYHKLPKVMNIPTNLAGCYVWKVFICGDATEESPEKCENA